MSDSPINFDAQEARCQNILDLWIEPLGLAHWNLTITFYRDKQDYQSQTGASDGGVAMCDCAWQYMNMHLSLNMPRMVEFDDSALERVLVHELVHSLINEMREADPDGKHEERVVSQLVMALRWVRNASVDGRLPRVSFSQVKEQDRPVGQCYDCGRAYDDPGWVEAIVPDDIWGKINPSPQTGGGLLCINCIALRCAKLGLDKVPITITAGPLVFQVKNACTMEIVC